MKKKGFTLVELLVVIAIIAMLLAILMPALGKVRQLAYRLMCGTNLSGLGKAMMVYSNDYEESYPKAKATYWHNSTTSTTAPSGFNWSQVAESTTTGPRTITASLYLLVKFADVSAAQFTCSSSDQKKFELDKNDTAAQNYVGSATTDAKDVTECWDFGTIKAGPKGPWDYCSYSYQMPYGNFAPGASSAAGLALLADRNPFIDTTAKKENFDGGTTAVTTGFFSLTKANLAENNKMKQGNAASHQGEGQNVLFADSHVSFEKTPNVGIQEDNIYTPWNTATSPTETDIQLGYATTYKGLAPCTSTTSCKFDSQASDDSFLVNDGPLLK